MACLNFRYALRQEKNEYEYGKRNVGILYVIETLVSP